MTRGIKKTQAKNVSNPKKPAKKKISVKKSVKKTTTKKAPAKKVTKKTTKKQAIKKVVSKKEISSEVKEPNYVVEEKQVLNTYQKQEEQKDRTLLMWAGVTFFMMLIGFVWIMNTKRVFQENKLSAPESNVNWSEMGKGIGETWGTLKQELEEIKESSKASSTEDQASSSSPIDGLATSTSTSDQLSAEEFEELKQKLKEIDERLGTSTSTNE